MTRTHSNHLLPQKHPSLSIYFCEGGGGESGRHFKMDQRHTVIIDPGVYDTIILLNDTEDQAISVSIEQLTDRPIINKLFRGKNFICLCNLRLERENNPKLKLVPVEKEGPNFVFSEQTFTIHSSPEDQAGVSSLVLSLLDTPLREETLKEVGKTLPSMPSENIPWEDGYLLFERKNTLGFRLLGHIFPTCKCKRWKGGSSVL